MKKSRLKAEDYLAATGRIRMLETRLATRERLIRMADAKDAADALKVLSECGYDTAQAVGKTGSAGLYALSAVINRNRAETMDVISGIIPNTAFTDFFRTAADYHNMKTLLKAGFAGIDPSGVIIPGGRIACDSLREIFEQRDYQALGKRAAEAAESAHEILLKTGDGQLADFEMDRAMLGDMIAFAKASESEFLLGYARLCVDSANLKAAVRLARMTDGGKYAQKVYAEGGNVSVSALLSAESLAAAYSETPLAQAAASGEAILESGGFTAFETECDAALAAYIATKKYAAYGPEVVAAYLTAKEREYTDVRTVISAKLAGMEPAAIRDRLSREVR